MTSAEAGRRSVRVLRYLVLAAVVVMGLVLLQRYDLERLPKDRLEMLGEVRPGGLMFLVGIDEDVALGPGTVVEALQPRDGRMHRFFARIAGTPGQRIRLEPRPDGRREVVVDGEGTRRYVAGETPLQAGVIPEGRYLLLVPNPGARTAVDSRQVGLLPHERLRRKLLASF